MPLPIEMRRVPVINPEGKVVTIPESQLAAAEQIGFKLTTSKVLGQAEEAATKEKLYGGALGMTAAVTGGAARGFTLGASDLLWDAAGRSEEAKLAKDVNPGLATAGELSAIGATLLTGSGAVSGASTLGKLGRGGRALESTLLAPRVVTRLGEAAAAGTERLIGTGGGLLARAGRKAATMGVQGATEGALYGAGHGISEAALGDHDLTAEKLLAEAGHGAVIGGLAGAAFGAGGELAGTGLRALRNAAGRAFSRADDAAGALTAGEARAADATAEGVAGATAETRAGIEGAATAEQRAALGAEQQIGDDLALTMKGPTTELSVEPSRVTVKDALEGLTGQDRTLRQRAMQDPARFYEKSAEQVAQDAANDLAPRLTSIQDGLSREIMPSMVGENRGFIASRLADGSKFDDQIGAAEKLMEEYSNTMQRTRQTFKSRVSQVKSELRGGKGKGNAHFNEDEAALEAFRRDVARISAPDYVSANGNRSGDLYMAVDEFRQHIGRKAGSAIHPEASIKTPWQVLYLEHAAPINQNAEVWGKMGEYAKAVNPEWGRGITLDRVASKTRVKTGEKSKLNPFVDEEVHDAGKIKGILEKAGDSESANDLAVWKKVVDQRVRLVKAVKANADDIGIAPERLAKLEQEATEAKAIIDATTERIQDIKKLNLEMAKGENPVVTALGMLPVAGPAIKFVATGGEMGARRTLYSIQKTVARMDSKVGTSMRGYLDSFVDSMTGAVSKATGGAPSSGAVAGAVARTRSPVVNATKIVGKKAIQAATSAARRTSGAATRTGLRAAGENEDFEERRSAILRANADPAATAERIASSIEPLTGVAPNVASAMTAKAIAGISYLASIAPQPPPHTSIMPGMDRWHPSQEEQDRWNRAFAVVESGPPVVLDSLKNGSLTREEVGALRAVYPSSFAQMQTTIMDRVTSMEAAGKPMAYEHRLQLGLLFGVPADPSQEPAVTASLQGVYSGAQQGGQGPSGSATAQRPKPIRLARPLSTNRFTASSDDIEEGLG